VAGTEEGRPCLRGRGRPVCLHERFSAASNHATATVTLRLRLRKRQQKENAALPAGERWGAARMLATLRQLVECGLPQGPYGGAVTGAIKRRAPRPQHI
jgi:hypothetical protein